MQPFSVTDLITIGCLALNCSDNPTSHDSATHQVTVAAPRRDKQGVLYRGIGSSQKDKASALKDAYGSVLQSVMLETGLEISLLNRYLVEAHSTNESFSATLDQRARASNYLTNAKIQYSKVTPSKEGYQAEVGVYLEKETLNQMHEWARAVRERRLALIKKHFIYGEGVVVKKPGQSLQEAQRIAKIKAYRDLYEQAQINVVSRSTIKNDNLSQESIEVRMAGTLKGVEQVSNEQIHKGNNTIIKTKVRMPTIVEETDAQPN